MASGSETDSSHGMTLERRWQWSGCYGQPGMCRAGRQSARAMKQQNKPLRCTHDQTFALLTPYAFRPSAAGSSRRPSVPACPTSLETPHSYNNAFVAGCIFVGRFCVRRSYFSRCTVAGCFARGCCVQAPRSDTRSVRVPQEPYTDRVDLGQREGSGRVVRAQSCISRLSRGETDRW